MMTAVVMIATMEATAASATVVVPTVLTLVVAMVEVTAVMTTMAASATVTAAGKDNNQLKMTTEKGQCWQRQWQRQQ